jgi:hypothetical protein
VGRKSNRMIRELRKFGLTYGVGKYGWVSASYSEAELPPIDLFREWIDESYRAQAPKKLVRELDANGV